MEDFIYNENSKELSFSYDGTLFLIDDNKETKILRGKIRTFVNNKSNCNIHVGEILYNSNEFNFNTISYSGGKKRYFNDIMEMHNHDYFANDGYKLEILSRKDLWNLPLGEIIFDSSSINKIALSKYVGPIVVAQGGGWFDKNKWLSYETRGKFTIVKKTQEPFYKNIIGRIDMDVLENNKVIYTIRNMEFNAGSFE